jgi:hypothetical protein
MATMEPEKKQEIEEIVRQVINQIPTNISNAATINSAQSNVPGEEIAHKIMSDLAIRLDKYNNRSNIYQYTALIFTGLATLFGTSGIITLINFLTAHSGASSFLPILFGALTPFCSLFAFIATGIIRIQNYQDKMVYTQKTIDDVRRELKLYQDSFGINPQTRKNGEAYQNFKSKIEEIEYYYDLTIHSVRDKQKSTTQ